MVLILLMIMSGTMRENFKVLDASAFIGGYQPTDKNNFTISEVTEELKDIQSKMIMKNALKDQILKIVEPDLESMATVETTIKKSGDILRLSKTDKKLLALAIHIKKAKGSVILITDDYSIQNVSKLLEIPFKTVLTTGIQRIYGWKKVCKGCKKEYSDNYSFEDCEICGSPIFKKRIKK
jgi:endoribonuclease Nob1